MTRWGKGVYGMMGHVERVAAGHYELRWQGNVVTILKLKQGPYNWVVRVDGVERFYAQKFNGALHWVDAVWGNEFVETVNLLNPGAGKVRIARRDRGGCTDPGTERYWAM